MQDDDKWPLKRGAEGVYWLLHHLCLFYWVIDRRELNDPAPDKEERWDKWRAGWIMVSLFLFIFLWLLNPGSNILMGLFAFLAGWRLLEILTTGLGTALLQEEQARARSLITIGLYGIQLTFIFAILYHSLATTAFVAASGPATRASDYLYISWSNLTSLGNNIYAPADSMARFLEASTGTAGILLLGVLLAFGIDAVKTSGKPKVLAADQGTQDKLNASGRDVPTRQVTADRGS